MRAWVSFFGLIAFITAGLWLATPTAQADLLFTGDDGGNNLYEMDTRAGELSKVVFCSQTHGVNGLGTDGKGKLFVSDFGTRTIRKFTLDGKYHTFATLESPGAAMAFDREGNLFLPYQGLWGGAGRIDKFSPDGSTRSILASDVPQPVQLVFDAAGRLFASDQKSGCIYVFDPYDGSRSTFATGLKSPIGLAFDTQGNLFAADARGQTIYKYSTNGVRTTFCRRLKTWPACLAFDSKGNLFMADGTGSIFEFKLAKGKLSPKPELVASGMGHNYFMTIMPGSMPNGILLSKAMAKMMATKWIRWTGASSALLIVVGGGFLLRRKLRRLIVRLHGWTEAKLGGFASRKSNRILGGLWSAYCGIFGFSTLFGLLDGISNHSYSGHALQLYLRVALCLMYLAGTVMSGYLFRGAPWARTGVGIVAVVSLAATIFFGITEHQLTLRAAAGIVICLCSMVWLWLAKPPKAASVAFQFLCPQCHQIILGDSDHSGKKVGCPVCQLRIIVPPSPITLQPASTG